MVTAQHGHRRTRTGYAWWRPAAYSAAAAAAVAALFNPLPALADPGSTGTYGAVPDAGSRPIPAGALVLPGQSSATTTTPITTSALAGSTNPTLQKIQKGRDEIAALGDELIQLGVVRDNAKTQQAAAEQRYTQSESDLRAAQSTAADAAAQEMLEAAAMPPGAADPSLLGLDDLAHMQRGQGGSTEAAARQLEQAQINAQLALDAQSAAEATYTDAVTKYTKLNAEIAKKQAAQQKLENANQDLLNAAEATENAANSQLGAQYLAGAEAGRGADPRAISALEFALAQRGKPYVWSTEGPNTYDCSGLMYAAYGSVGFQLQRVSRDQYWQTRGKVVDRYSLLPGDLLFFSYSNSWRGIHHVAMYAGNGMMVEAPRTGLNVRLVPVRWTELFQATRVFGSVEGGSTEGPALGSPDPQPTETTPTPTHTPTPSHSATPTPTHSTSPTPSHSTTPTPTPSKSTSPSESPSPSATPTTSSTPAPTSTPPTSSPSTSSSGGGSSSGSTYSASESAGATGSGSSSSSSKSSSSSSSSSAGAN